MTLILRARSGMPVACPPLPSADVAEDSVREDCSGPARQGLAARHWQRPPGGPRRGATGSPVMGGLRLMISKRDFPGPSAVTDGD